MVVMMPMLMPMPREPYHQAENVSALPIDTDENSRIRDHMHLSPHLESKEGRAQSRMAVSLNNLRVWMDLLWRCSGVGHQCRKLTQLRIGCEDLLQASTDRR